MPLILQFFCAFVFLVLSQQGYCQKFEDVTPKPGKGPLTAIPILGLGTYQINLSIQNSTDVIAGAIENGYRHFDTAAIYNNQKQLAPGFKEGLRRVKDQGVTRKDLWVTSKLWNSRHGDKCETGLKETLGELGLEYLDLYLMHFPVGDGRVFDHVATWKCMQTLVRSTGPRTRYIGISNFSPAQLTELLASQPTIRPFAHQMELHPYLQQSEWVARHKTEHITVIGYAPLGNTSPAYQSRFANPSFSGTRPVVLLQNPAIVGIAKERGCTAAQVVLAWNMARGVAVIPKTVHLDRQRENLEAREKCKLNENDKTRIMEMPKTYGASRFNNPCAMMRMHCYEGLEADPVPAASVKGLRAGNMRMMV